MKRKLVLEFTKMNGAGNDFIIIDNRFFHFKPDELSDLARRFCPRRTGIGADGLLAYSVPNDDAHHFRMEYYNADGSRATMCGNGARCLARYARQAGLKDAAIHFETDAGVFQAVVPEDPDAPVRLLGYTPRDWEPRVELQSEVRLDRPLHFLWTGTEHTVCFVPDVALEPVVERGRRIRHDPALAPAGANVNFVTVVTSGDADHEAVLSVRTFEKGVEDETLACGTGALAAALAGLKVGLVASQRVQVQMPGGTLTVGFKADGESVRDVYLEGPAQFVFRGTVEV